MLPDRTTRYSASDGVCLATTKRRHDDKKREVTSKQPLILCWTKRLVRAAAIDHPSDPGDARAGVAGNQTPSPDGPSILQSFGGDIHAWKLHLALPMLVPPPVVLGGCFLQLYRCIVPCRRARVNPLNSWYSKSNVPLADPKCPVDENPSFRIGALSFRVNQLRDPARMDFS
jgi:hypothetical protein